MRLAIRAAALGLLASVALAAPSAAELAPRLPGPPYNRTGGPVFAGEAVVWGHGVHGGYELVTLRGGERTTTPIPMAGFHGALGRDASASIEASDRRVVAGVVGSACFTRAACAARHYTQVYRAVVTGPVGGEVTVVAGCTTAADCASSECAAYAPDASEDAIAYADCHGVHVRDFAAGASPAARDYPKRFSPRLAGSYLASSIAEDSVTVSNWRTGADAYTIDPAVTYDAAYDVQDDGKLAFNSIRWASPSEPYPHEVVNSYLNPHELRMANDHIAGRFENPPSDQFDSGYLGQQFDVLGLAQQPNADEYAPRLGDLDATYRMDFDGTRLMWMDAVCRHGWLRIQNPSDDAPAGDVPNTCPLPRVVHGSAHVAADHSLRLRLECRVPPGPACVGWARRVGTHGKLLTLVRYSIREGRTTALRFPRTGSLCRAGHHRARVRIALTAGRTQGFYDPVERTVTARGPAGGLPSC